MKEATGELNVTVITVVAIAAVAALFYAFLWPSLTKSISDNAICANGAGSSSGIVQEGAGNIGNYDCHELSADAKSYTCDYINNDGKKVTATCKQK